MQDEKLLKIEKNIWDDFIKNDTDNIGLYVGLSGIILFYDSLFEAYPIEEYENKLLEVIEKVNEVIEVKQDSMTLCTGVAGYGLVLLRLKNKSIDIDEEYFETIDDILIEEFELLCSKNGFDFMHEAMGVAMYFIERYKISKNDKIAAILSNFSRDFIHKINADFKNVLVKNDDNRGDYYSLGLAHGVAGYLNFLLYLHKHFPTSDADIRTALRTCIEFLFSYKGFDDRSNQYYANVYSLKTKNFIPSRLSWCQGDLGVSNALYNTGVFLDDDSLINEAIELMNHSVSLDFKNSYINDFGFCHGSSGVLIQFYLAQKKYNIDYSQKIDYWFEILKEQTSNFEEYPWYSNREEKYFPEMNLLVGAVGLGLTILTVEDKISTNWLEMFNLH
jgi:lantibiotic modifying enzyme